MNRERGTISRFKTPKIKADRPAEKLSEGIPLAKVITRRLAVDPEIVMMNRPRSALAERFRRLKTSLVNLPDGPPQVIVLTSPGPGEGKSLVAINLALAFAADRRGEVLLFDADLRRPSIGRWLTPPPQLGLSEIVEQEVGLDHAVLKLDSSPLKILPAGTPARDPAELLASDQTRELMTCLRDRYQTIIIDTPPVVPFTDADVIGALSDGVVLIARAGVTASSSFWQALSLVTSTQVLGTVLNATTFSLADWREYNSDSYEKYYDKKREK